MAMNNNTKKRSFEVVCKVCNSHGSWGPTKVSVAGKRTVVESSSFGMLDCIARQDESRFMSKRDGVRVVFFMDFKDASEFMLLCLLYSNSVNKGGFVRKTLFEFLTSKKCEWEVTFYDIKNDPSDKHSKGDFPVGNSVRVLVGKDDFAEFKELAAEVVRHLELVE